METGIQNKKEENKKEKRREGKRDERCSDLVPRVESTRSFFNVHEHDVNIV